MLLRIDNPTTQLTKIPVMRFVEFWEPNIMALGRLIRVMVLNPVTKNIKLGSEVM
jgi:hypothetical protein